MPTRENERCTCSVHAHVFDGGGLCVCVLTAHFPSRPSWCRCLLAGRRAELTGRSWSPFAAAAAVFRSRMPRRQTKKGTVTGGRKGDFSSHAKRWRWPGSPPSAASPQKRNTRCVHAWDHASPSAGMIRARPFPPTMSLGVAVAGLPLLPGALLWAAPVAACWNLNGWRRTPLPTFVVTWQSCAFTCREQCLMRNT